MYNDYGSLMRDRVERNLNIVNFPEFTCIPRSDQGLEQDLKESVMCLAHHKKMAHGGLTALLQKVGQS